MAPVLGERPGNSQASRLTIQEPQPGVLVKRFSGELESRGRQDADTAEFDQARLDLTDYQRELSRERRDGDMRRIEAFFAQTRSEDETSFEKAKAELMELMKSFQALVPPDLRTAKTPSSWSEVDLAVSTVLARWDERSKRSHLVKAKQWFRKLCNGLNDHSAALSILPKDSEYVSVIAGAVTMVIKAAANYTDITEAFCQGIVDINDAVAVVQVDRVYDSPHIQQLVMRLYARVFSYLTKFMTWFTNRSRSRFLTSFNENVKRVFEKDIKQVKETSNLLTQLIHRYMAADVKMGNMLAQKSNQNTEYLIQLFHNQETQRSIQEATTQRLLQRVLREQFDKLEEEIKESSQRIMAEYSQWMPRQISGMAMTNLLEHQVSRDISGSSPISTPASSPRSTRLIQSGSEHGSAPGMADLDVSIQYRSRHLHRYCNWNHVFPFADLPDQLCIEAPFVARLRDFTMVAESEVLYAQGRYHPEGLNLLRLSAAKFAHLARANGLPVVSYFCGLDDDEPPTPLPDGKRRSAELTSLLYSVLRQVVELLPAESVVSELGGEGMFARLDGTPRSWDCAIELISILVRGHVRLPRLLFVIDSLILLEDDFLKDDPVSNGARALVQALARLAVPPPAGAESAAGSRTTVKILFTTAGISVSLTQELDDTQVVICNGLVTPPIGSSKSPRSRRHFFY